MRRFTLIALLFAGAVFGANTAGMKSGKAELKWAGSLAFGPDAARERPGERPLSRHY